MNSTARATFQQQRIHHFSSNIDSLEYFNLLTSDELAKEVQALLPDHRERVFPPIETRSLFLAQVMSPDQSCQQTVNQAAIDRLAIGCLPAARELLSKVVFQHLNQAATWSTAFTSIPSRNSIPVTTFAR